MRSQQEMIPEDPILSVIENAPADQAEVGDEILALPGIDPPALLAAAEFQRNTANVRSVFHAIPETSETCTKNSPEHALARYLFALMDKTQAVTVTGAARFFGQTDGVRSIPLH